MESTTTIERRSTRRPGLVGWLTENTLAGMARRKAMLGYLFLLPTMVGILVFTAGPVVVSLGLSLFEWNVFSPPEFVGIENYRQLLNDTQALTSFTNMAKLVVIGDGLRIIVGLFLALALAQKRMSKRLRYFFRSVFYLPLLTSAASISLVLGYMFHENFGLVNYYLGLLRVPRIPWLVSSKWALIAVALAYFWHGVGFVMILFIGGLGNISREVLDAADVDGAYGWRRLWYVTLPLLSPTILFVTVVQIIDGLQAFVFPYVLTHGGPGDASRTIVMTLYDAAFARLEIGYGATIAVLLFLLILLVTAVQFWLSKRWVFYQ